MRRLRAQKGISQEELANKAGINRSYVSDMEREVYAASVDLLDKLAKVLQVDSSALLSRSTAAKSDGS